MHIHNSFLPTEIIANILCYSDTSCSSVCTVFHKLFFPAFLDNCRNSLWLKDRVELIDEDSSFADSQKIKKLRQDMINRVKEIGEDSLLGDILTKKAFLVADLNRLGKEIADSNACLINLFHQIAVKHPIMTPISKEWKDKASHVLSEDNWIKKIRFSFEQAQSMRTWMKNNQIELLSKTELDLKYRDYVGYQFQPKLPKEIGLLRYLTRLIVACSTLKELPPEIGQLTQLTSLILQRNKLTALPKEIGQLTQLISLNVVNNELTTLPSEIGQLTQLESIGLDHNPLESIPKEMKQLTQLSFFTVGYRRGTAAQIAQLPFTLLEGLPNRRQNT